VGDAVVLLAHQLSPRAFEQHHAGRRAVDAQLVLDGAGAQVVGEAEAAVLVHQPLGGQEQGDALHPRRSVGKAGQHQVADIVRRVVVAPGDEDLLAVQTIAAFAIGLGPSGHRGQVRTGLRFGQVHGAGPFAGHQLGQDQPLLALGPVQVQGLDRRLGQHRAEAEGHVRRMHHLEHGQLHGLGQALAAVLGIGRQRVPAPGHEGPVGVGQAGRRIDLAVLELGADLVGLAVEGRQLVLRELAGGFQHGHDRIAVQVRKPCLQERRVAGGLQREGEVADRGAEGHGIAPN
jgi:hypothetical protein